MVQTNTVMFGWNRAIPGREGMAAELFAHTLSYFDRLKSAGQLDSFEPVFLNRHGGDLNGFFLLKAPHDKLDQIMQSDEWIDLAVRAEQYLMGLGIITGHTGMQSIQDLMTRWVKSIPSR